MDNPFDDDEDWRNSDDDQGCQMVQAETRHGGVWDDDLCRRAMPKSRNLLHGEWQCTLVDETNDLFDDDNDGEQLLPSRSPSTPVPLTRNQYALQFEQFLQLTTSMMEQEARDNPKDDSLLKPLRRLHRVLFKFHDDMDYILCRECVCAKKDSQLRESAGVDAPVAAPGMHQTRLSTIQSRLDGEPKVRTLPSSFSASSSYPTSDMTLKKSSRFSLHDLETRSKQSRHHRRHNPFEAICTAKKTQQQQQQQQQQQHHQHHQEQQQRQLDDNSSTDTRTKRRDKIASWPRRNGSKRATTTKSATWSPSDKTCTSKSNNKVPFDRRSSRRSLSSRLSRRKDTRGSCEQDKDNENKNNDNNNNNNDDDDDFSSNADGDQGKDDGNPDVDVRMRHLESQMWRLAKSVDHIRRALPLSSKFKTSTTTTPSTCK